MKTLVNIIFLLPSSWLGVSFWLLVHSFLPKSPCYFVKLGKFKNVRQLLATLYSKTKNFKFIEAELAEIVANAEYKDKAIPSNSYLSSWTNCFIGSLLWRCCHQSHPSHTTIQRLLLALTHKCRLKCQAGLSTGGGEEGSHRAWYCIDDEAVHLLQDEDLDCLPSCHPLLQQLKQGGKEYQIQSKRQWSQLPPLWRCQEDAVAQQRNCKNLKSNNWRGP